MSAEAVYVASPYSDIFIGFAKILAMVGNKQNWRMSLSVYVHTVRAHQENFSPR